MHQLACIVIVASLATACVDPDPGRLSVTRLATPAGPGSAEPHLARGTDGTVVLNWLEGPRDDVALRYSVLDADGWRPARTVATGTEWFVNWADFPSVSPIAPGLWAAHWLAKRPGGIYSYDVAVALSDDHGESWSVALTPHDDGTPTEHGFVSLFPWQGAVGALWLDGRNTSGEGDAHDAGHGGMTLRSAVIAADLSVSDPQLVDDLVCDCCQTDVAIGPDGPIAVYRDRSDDEIRDVYVSRAVDDRWLPGVPIHDDGWRIAGCPVNGPAIAAAGKHVAVAWFTAADTPRVRLALSNDGARTFDAPVEINSRKPLGRVDVEWLESGHAVVSWLEKSGLKKAELVLRTVSTSGETGAVHVIARTAASRPAGFPQMVRDGRRLVLAWTAADGDVTRVMTASVDIAAL